MAAAISQAERYKRAERQRAPNGKWYLSPSAFCRFVGIGQDVLFRDWRPKGIPILDHEALDTAQFYNGDGRLIDFYSEKQGRRIIKAREGTARNRLPVRIVARRFGLKAGYVSALAKAGEIDAVRQPTTTKGGVTVSSFFINPDSLRVFLQRKKQATKTQRISDPISKEEAARLAGVAPCTVIEWANQGKIRHEEVRSEGAGPPSWKFSRQEVLAFAAELRRVRGSGGGEEWLYGRQVLRQFPNVSDWKLRWYTKHDVPPLRRPLLPRLVERPRGLRGRFPEVRQWATSEVRVLAEWLASQSPAAGDAPQSASAIPDVPSPSPRVDRMEPVPHLAEAKASPPPKKRRGRPKGRDPEVVQREKDMLDEWERGVFGTNKAAAGRAHGFDRSDATKLINDYERGKL